MIVRYCRVRRVSENIDDFTCVHQLRGEEREWKMSLDDPPPLNVGHMFDGVLEHVSDLGVGEWNLSLLYCLLLFHHALQYHLVIYSSSLNNGIFTL